MKMPPSTRVRECDIKERQHVCDGAVGGRGNKDGVVSGMLAGCCDVELVTIVAVMSDIGDNRVHSDEVVD